jgi:hypothetical protein
MLIRVEDLSVGRQMLHPSQRDYAMRRGLVPEIVWENMMPLTLKVW